MINSKIFRIKTIAFSQVLNISFTSAGAAKPALAAALLDGAIAGAGLDVFDEEPLRDVVDTSLGYVPTDGSTR